MKTARTKPAKESLSFLFGAVCVFIIPLAIFPGTFEEFRASKALATSLVCAPFALFMLWRQRDQSPKGWRLFALLLAAAIPIQSLLFAEWERRLQAEPPGIDVPADLANSGAFPLHPGFAEGPNLESLAHLAAVLLAFLAAFHWSVRARFERQHLRVFAAAAATVLGVGLLVTHTNAVPFIPRSTMTALASTLGNSNELAEWATPLLLFALFTRPPESARTRALLFLSSLSLLLLSGSRGGILALAVGSLVGLWLTRPCGDRPECRWMRRERRAVFAALAISALIVLSLPTARERALSAFDLEHPTNAIRLDLWTTAVRAIEHNPLFGIGFHRIEAGLEPYRSAREQAEEWRRLGRHTVIESPHQEALWLLCAGGLPFGLLAIGGALWLLRRQSVAVRRGGLATEAAGAFAALTAVLVFACIRSPLQHVSGILVLGLALGQIEFFATAGALSTSGPDSPSKARLLRPHWLWALGFCAALFLGVRFAPAAASLWRCSAPQLEGIGDFITLIAAGGLLLIATVIRSSKAKRQLLECLLILIAASLVIEDVIDDAAIDRLRRTKREAVAEQARDPRAVAGPTWAALGEQAKALASQREDLGWRRAARLVPEVADLASLRLGLEAATQESHASIPIKTLLVQLPDEQDLWNLITTVQREGPVHVVGYSRWHRLCAHWPEFAKAGFIDWLKGSIARAPMTPELRVIAAELAMGSGEAAAALAWLRGEAQLFKNPPASVRRAIGVALLSLDTDPRAFRREQVTGDPAAAQDWLKQASRSIAEFEPTRAQEEALIALSIDPTSAEAFELIAQAGYAVPEGMEATRARAWADQAAASSRIAYAREAIAARDFALAQRTLKLALRKRPEHLEGLWLLARVLAELGEASELRERLLELRGRGVARADLQLRAEEEDFKDAIKAILASLD